jgi:GntR family transcriptional regulator, rspAB operon transcriptional repressor
MRQETYTPARTKDEVFHVLVEEILTDRLPPGTALAERALAERFGLSRTPIREVLLRLQREYLVDFYPNQGAFVRHLTPNDIRDLFQLRESLEPLAAALAADHCPDAALQELAARFEAIGDARQAPAKVLTGLGEALHDACAEWSGNELLIDIYGMLRKQTRLVRSMTRTHQEVEAVSYGEHVAILDALRARDAAGARERMLDHLRRSHAVVIDLILRS